MRRFLLFCFCWLGVTAAFGQYVSRLGHFSVDEIKGCAPFTVTITDANLITTGECTGGPTGKPCLMDFQDDGNTSTNQFTFTYNTPGTYKLSVLYQSIGADDITITVTDNTDPNFQVYTCTGNKVTVKVTDKTYETYQIDFNNDGTIDDTIPMGNNATSEFDYGTLMPVPPVPSTFTIAVRGKNQNAANNCKILTEAYTTLNTLPTPSITSMTAVDANNLTMNLAISPHILYKLEIAINNSSTFQVYQDVYQANSVSVPSLLVDNNFYCFRISAHDPCSGADTYSNVICSQDFDVNFLNGSNELVWDTSPSGIISVDIRRNGSQYSNIPGSPSSFSDADYDCNQQYCYQVITNYGGGATSTSLTKCGVGRLEITYPPIENITSVVRAGVELSYTVDPTLKIDFFDILKRVGNEPLTQYAQTKDMLYIDANYDYNGGICYQVNYGDLCNNHSTPGIIACPMALSGTLDELSNAITLKWNSYSGYKDGVSTYQVNKYTRDGVLLGVYPTTDTTFVDNDPADDEQVVIYSIVALANEPGVDKSFSNNITIEKPVRLIIPTAFTPNGDVINPTFTITGKFVSKINLEIFDRWGVLIFSSDKNEPWDGTKSGKPMPESAYVWKAEVEDSAGNTFTEKGTVILLRPRN